MENRKITTLALQELMQNGAEKATVLLNENEIQEFVLEGGKINLLRTTKQKSLTLEAIIDFKKNDKKINQLSAENIKAKAKEVVIAAQNSEPDKANDIGEFQKKEEFHKGIFSPDIDKLYERTIEFLEFSKKNYPSLIMEHIITNFTYGKDYFLNSNGTDVSTKEGYYTIVAMFTSKDGKKTSSFNYAYVETVNLDTPFAELGRFAQLMKESTEQTEMKHIPENFVGDVIITPECFENFLHYFASMISTYPLITKTSIFKDKINCKIAADQFTLHSKPVNEDFATGYFFDDDGYKVENFPYVKNGVLQSFILGLYGSNKTGLPRSANSGYYWEVEAGDKTYDEIVKSTQKGILMCRFSGGRPAQNGDFSGVAKNSYYIEDGKIQFPISETMVAGNIAESLLNIVNISEERIHFGSSLIPWVKIKDLHISGNQ